MLKLHVNENYTRADAGFVTDAGRRLPEEPGPAGGNPQPHAVRAQLRDHPRGRGVHGGAAELRPQADQVSSGVGYTLSTSPSS